MSTLKDSVAMHDMLVDLVRGTIGLLPDWSVFGAGVHDIVGFAVMCLFAVWVLRRARVVRAAPLQSALQLAKLTGLSLPVIVSTAWLYGQFGSVFATVGVWGVALAAPLLALGVHKLRRERNESPIRGGLTKWRSRPA
jgi:hypothetical protein